MERRERENALQLMEEVAVVAEKLLAAALTATTSLDATRQPEQWKQALIELSFDLATRFVIECKRREAQYRCDDD
jgi:hypothetical protein